MTRRRVRTAAVDVVAAVVTGIELVVVGLALRAGRGAVGHRALPKNSKANGDPVRLFIFRGGYRSSMR